jgi:hypothetical protein
LPDLKTWRQEFRAVVGELFTIQGVEANVEGRLVEIKGQLMLQRGMSKAMVRLGPLQRKVQWDPEKDQPQPATPTEKEAYQRLVIRFAQFKGPAPLIRIVGPLQEAGKEAGLILTVRDCSWE